MFQHILVPIDDSERNADAILLGQHLCERTGADLVLLRIEPTVVSGEKVTDSSAALEQQVQDLRRQGVNAQYVVEYGTPAEGIADLARHQHSDLIILAPRRRTGLDTILDPSVTARMFSRSPAPLLIWPEAMSGQTSAAFGAPGSVIIVPLDGSDLAERALPFALALASEYQRPLLLVRIVEPVVLVAAGAEAMQLARRAEQNDELDALRYLRSTRQRITEQTGIPVQTMVRIGMVAKEIEWVAETHPASLVVMSTHGRGGLAKLLFGSVATAVMRNTQTPLLVVPPQAILPMQIGAETQAQPGELQAGDQQPADQR